MKTEITDTTKRGAQLGSSAIVMPVECGRYLWDDEPVTVYWQDDVLMGETSTECDTVEELDMLFRTENSMQHQMTADAPWQRVGDCYEDGCESARHNEKLRHGGENQ